MAMIATIDKKQNRQQGFYSLLPILLLFSCSNGFNKVKNKPKIFLVIFPWKALQPSPHYPCVRTSKSSVLCISIYLLIYYKTNVFNSLFRSISLYPLVSLCIGGKMVALPPNIFYLHHIGESFCFLLDQIIEKQSHPVTRLFPTSIRSCLYITDNSYNRHIDN